MAASPLSPASLPLILWEKYFGRKFFIFILFYLANGIKDKCTNICYL